MSKHWMLSRSIQYAYVLITLAISGVCPPLQPSELAEPAEASGTNLAESATDFGSSAESSQEDVAGLVMRVTGDWEMRSSKTVRHLRRGDAVINGSLLSKISKDGAITVVLTDGNTLKCPGGAECIDPIAVRKQQSLMDSWLVAAINMFVQRPGDWANAESRELDLLGQKQRLNDAVIESGADQIDLAPIFTDFEDGSYSLQIYKASNGGTNKRNFGPAAISVQSGKPVVVESQISAGLYRVKLTCSKDDPSPAEAFVLISDPEHYRNNQLLFDKATAASKDLKQTVSATAVQELLRAYLGCLDVDAQASGIK